MKNLRAATNGLEWMSDSESARESYDTDDTIVPSVFELAFGVVSCDCDEPCAVGVFCPVRAHTVRCDTEQCWFSWALDAFLSFDQAFANAADDAAAAAAAGPDGATAFVVHLLLERWPPVMRADHTRFDVWYAWMALLDTVCARAFACDEGRRTYAACLRRATDAALANDVLARYTLCVLRTRRTVVSGTHMGELYANRGASPLETAQAIVDACAGFAQKAK